MAHPQGITLWGWWLAAAATAVVGAYAPTPTVQLALIACWAGVVVLARRRLWSPRPFFFGLIAAAAFVAVRLLYTALFGGVSPLRAEGTVLWVLPQVWLTGPFSGIHLFGSVSLEMLLTAASDALQFAVVFVAFGAASSLVDTRHILARAPKLLAGVALTLTLALNLFSSLVLATKSLNRARLLRGERSRWRMLLPLFEQTLERAQAMALSLLSRGWQRREEWDDERAQRVRQSLDDAPLLTVSNLRVAYGSRRVLDSVTFSVSGGSLTLITGATGSGKSTLLAHLRGCVEPGEAVASGEVLVDGVPASLDLNIGLTTQRPEQSFVAATVREELEFSASRVNAELLAERLGIAHLLERRIERLSAGEASRVAVAAAAASQPRLLLLDEPVADLDQDATRRLIDTLRTLLREGTAIVVAEHRPKGLVALADQVLHLEAGAVTPLQLPAQATQPDRPVQPVGAAASAERVLAARPGSITAIVGENGSGKTTLCEGLALTGRTPNPEIALVSYRVDDYFFSATLADEFRRNDRRERLKPGTTEGLARRLVPDLPPLTTHPRDCSAGTRVALAIALQLSLCRPLLVLDEPTRGLDTEARSQLAGMLRETSVHQIAVVFATHDSDFVREVADEVLVMPPLADSPNDMSRRPLPVTGVTHAR